MYSINLAKITIDEFEKTLLTMHILPSQRIILKELSVNMQKFKNRGFSNLQDLQNLLKKKKDYDFIAKEINIDKEFLIILNRMINSYVVKISPLQKLNIFTCEELMELTKEMFTNTKNFYETFKDIEQRLFLSNRLGIPIDKLEYALHIVDLLRINGVGVEYAKALYYIGIKTIDDYNKTPSEVILKNISEYNKNYIHSKSTLGISDIDYCRRFCEKLDCDIEYNI